MEGKKNQLEQVADVLKGMFNEKELAMMEAEYQKMLAEWEANKAQKEWDDMNANWEDRKEDFLNSAYTKTKED